MKQLINIVALMFSGFAVGYCVGLNPTPAEQVTTSETFVARVTAYCQNSCCCGNSADGITANGHVIRPGEKFCAAPKSIPFGTMIEIPGYGTVPVWDRGGAIKEGRLDVFFPTHRAAREWGVKNLQVKIVR